MSQTKAQLISDLVQALAFTATASAPTNGMFLSASNTLAISTNSTQRLTVNSSGNVGIGTSSPGAGLDVVGNSTMLRLYDGTNTSTGKISQSSDVITLSQAGTSSGALAFATGSGALGTERMRIDGSGNVGIGKTSPSAFLDVESASDQTVLRLRNNSGNNTRLLFANKSAGLGEIFYQGDFRFVDDENSDTERLRIDSSGRVGIGTSSPSQLLDISSSGNAVTRINSGSSNTTGVILSRGGTEVARVSSAATDTLTFSTGSSATTRLTINSSGNVGIGTTSPTELLHIRKDASAVVAIKAQNNNSNGIMEYQAGNDADNWFFGIGSDDAFGISDVTGQAGRRLTITQTGNVGIGTTSPDEILHVANTGGGASILIETNASSGGNLLFGDDGSNTVGRVQYVHSDNSMRLHTNGSERMRIDTAGNVGVNTSNPQAELHLNDATGLSRIRLSGGANLADNFELGQGTTSVTNGGFEIRDVDESATRFVITSIGAVGIGVTSPAAGASNTPALDVDGPILASRPLAAHQTGKGVLQRSGNVIALRAYGETAGTGQIAFNTGGGGDSSDTERMRIDTAGRLLVGVSSTVSVAGSSSFIQHHGNKTTSNLALVGYNNNLGGPILSFGASRSTTVGTPGTAVSSGDFLGDIRFAGDDGTDINTVAAAIRGEVEGTPGSNNVPGRLVFTTAASGSSATERMRINSVGNVKLTGGEALFWDDAGDRYIACIGDTTSNINLHGRANVIFETGGSSYDGGTERMRINSSGNVGIGTSSPTEKLSINGNLQFEAQDGIQIGAKESLIVNINSSGGQSSRVFEFRDNGTARVTCQQAGNVGIGTTSPSQLVTLSSGSDTNLLLTTTNNTAHDRINFTNSGSSASGGLWYGSGNTMEFRTNDTERMRINSSGNVGIGETSPLGKLHVKTADSGASSVGASADEFVIEGSAHAGMTILSGTSDQGIINFGDSDDINIGGITYNHTGNSLVFRANDAERARLTSDGYLYVGTTTADGKAHVLETSAPQSMALVVRNTNSNNSVATNGIKLLYSVTPNDTNNAIQFSTNSGTPFVVRNNGNVQNTNGSYTSFSDARFKENIVDASSQWDDIKNIRIRNWNFRPELGWATHTMLGPVAQELELVSPGLVIDNPVLDDDNNPTGEVEKSVNQSVLYMKAVKALQEAMDRIETLEAKVAALEAE